MFPISPQHLCYAYLILKNGTTSYKECIKETDMAFISLNNLDLSKEPHPVVIFFGLLAAFICILFIYLDYAKAKQHYASRNREHNL